MKSETLNDELWKWNTVIWSVKSTPEWNIEARKTPKPNQPLKCWWIINGGCSKMHKIRFKTLKRGQAEVRVPGRIRTRCLHHLSPPPLPFFPACSAAVIAYYFRVVYLPLLSTEHQIVLLLLLVCLQRALWWYRSVYSALSMLWIAFSMFFILSYFLKEHLYRPHCPHSLRCLHCNLSHSSLYPLLFSTCCTILLFFSFITEELFFIWYIVYIHCITSYSIRLFTLSVSYRIVQYCIFADLVYYLVENIIMTLFALILFYHTILQHTYCCTLYLCAVLDNIYIL